MMAGLIGFDIANPEKTNKKINDEFIAKNIENQQEVSFKGGAPKSVDITKNYTQDEIVDILKLVGTYKEQPYKSKYSVEYNPNTGNMIINNTNCTNDTTVILKDGSVRHCGSWHNEEVAPKGSYTYLVTVAESHLAVEKAKPFLEK